MRVGQVVEYAVDQVVTRQDHTLDSLGSLGQALDKSGVVRFQKELIRLGYPIGSADGIVGPKTRKATSMVQTKINEFYKSSKVSVDGAPSMAVLREMDSGNRALFATAEDKASFGVASSTGGGLVTTGGGAPAVSSGGVTDPFAPGGSGAEGGIMKKYEEWLKQQAWLPEQLKNPYVAAGVVTVGVAVVGYGLYRIFRSEPSPEAAMAGMTELEKMMQEQGSREPYYTTDYKPKKPKKRRKIRKAKTKK